MKKIAIDIRMLESGGVGTYIFHVVPHLLKSLGEVDFFLLGDTDHEIVNQWELEFTNVKVINCSASIYSISEQIELWRKIPRDVDFVFSPHFNISIAWAHRTITTIHDCFHLEYFRTFSFAKRCFLKLIFSMIRNFGLGILTVSKFSQSQISKFLNIPLSDIIVTPLGVDPYNGEIIYDKEEFFLFVGNLKPHKNIEVIVNALDEIKDDVPHNLIIVGSADNHINPDVQVVDYKKKLNSRISFTGFISNEELRELYKRATALIFPSLYEGFGLPALEAKSFGCPTILSDIPAFREINNDSSLFFPPKSSSALAHRMLEMINEDSLKLSLINFGLNKSQNTPWDCCFVKTNEVFERLIKKNI